MKYLSLFLLLWVVSCKLFDYDPVVFLIKPPIREGLSETQQGLSETQQGLSETQQGSSESKLK